MDIDTLAELIGTPRDSAMLRLTLARLLTGAGRTTEAEEQLVAAVSMDGAYAAAWKELGRLRLQRDDQDGAAAAWQQGIAAARQRGDKQAEREMTVFLRRVVS